MLTPCIIVRGQIYWDASVPMRNAGAELRTRSRVSRTRFRGKSRSRDRRIRSRGRIRSRDKTRSRGRSRPRGGPGALAKLRALAKTITSARARATHRAMTRIRRGRISSGAEVCHITGILRNTRNIEGLKAKPMASMMGWRARCLVKTVRRGLCQHRILRRSPGT